MSLLQNSDVGEGFDLVKEDDVLHRELLQVLEYARELSTELAVRKMRLDRKVAMYAYRDIGTATTGALCSLETAELAADPINDCDADAS